MEKIIGKIRQTFKKKICINIFKKKIYHQNFNFSYIM